MFNKVNFLIDEILFTVNNHFEDKKNRLNPQKLGPPNERNTVHYEADITIKTNVL